MDKLLSSQSRISFHSSFIYQRARDFLSFYSGSNYFNEVNYYACYVNRKSKSEARAIAGQKYGQSTDTEIFKNFF